MPSKKHKTRAFKTKRFAKSASKALISDKELCEAIKEVMAGRAIDLGGGVFKKRLNNNEHRSLILAKGGRLWIYQHLFAKKDVDNISSSELESLKNLAKAYEALSAAQLNDLIEAKDLQEICDDEKKIQK